MKRKVFAMMLACVLGAAMLLGGCGGSGSQGEDAPAAGSAAGEAAGGAAYDQVSLTLTTTYNEQEYAGQLITHFADYLADKSGGNVAIEVYWGGTLAGNGEELSFVGTGAADMSIIGQSTYTDVLSLLNFPSHVLGGYQNAIDLMDGIAFENEATAAAVQAQIEAQNVKMLGSVAAGSNSFIAKSEVASLDDLKGSKLGVGMNQSAFEEMGLNVVTTMPWDYYDSLSRGIVDCGYMSTAALVSMSIHEVTPYFLSDGTYTAGNFFTINLDKWNGMSADTQALFAEAMADTQAFSVTLAEQLDKDAVATIEAAGGALVTLPEADQAVVNEAFFTTGVVDARAFAETAGCAEDMEAVLAEVSKVVGVEMQ